MVRPSPLSSALPSQAIQSQSRGLPPPARFHPALATLAARPPEGAGWLHEIKLDGYRIGCRIDRGIVTLLSRRNNDWTSMFPEIAAAAKGLDVENAFLDGEAAVLLSDGRTSFHALQQALTGGDRKGLVYCAFDLLHLDGESISVLPLEERKRRLALLLKQMPPDLPLRYTDHVLGRGAEVFAQASALGLEGIVSKQLGRAYPTGRSAEWLKIKANLRQEFVIGGFTERAGAGGARNQENTGEIGALLCGTYALDGRLEFAGKVGTGFSARDATDLRRSLGKLEIENCAFSPPPDALSRRGARWVSPSVVAEIVFQNWTDDGKMRHSSFVGLRTDKDPRHVHREIPRVDKSK